MTVEARKRAELGAKCEAFLLELDQWKTMPREFPQHTAQIQRLTGILLPLGTDLGKRIERQEAAPLVAKSFTLSAQVLLLYRIWSHYRDKFAQRFVVWQRPFLEIADELAYRYWKPALDAVVATKPSKHRAAVAREPPLVYLNGDASPLTVTRKIAFTPERAEGLDEREVAWARKVLRRSPVPVIGMPYFASRHIPDLLVIAHEVGHNVEDDFGLTGELARAVAASLAGKKGEHKRAWAAWTGEIFADVWGVLSAGPAFVDALLDLVAASPSALAEETQVDAAWGLYPTTALRAELLFCTLEATGFQTEAETRRAAFEKRVGLHAMADFTNEAPLVTRALLDLEPAAFKKPIHAIGGVAAAQSAAVLTESGELGKGRKPKSRDTAVLAQAICLAFGDDPARIATTERSKVLWAALAETVVKGVRAGRIPAAQPRDIAAADADLVSELSREWDS